MKIKRLLLSGLLVLVIACQEKANQTQMVTAEEMETLIKMENTQLIDVRTQEEFAKGHIEGAQNIVFDDDFEAKLTQLDKNKPIAVYCRTGKRSADCAEFLEKAGFTKIYDLDGGITQWVYKGKDTIQ